MEKIYLDILSSSKELIESKKKEGLTLKEQHINNDGSCVLTFYDAKKEDIRSEFDKWLDACPDGKIKEWIKEGRQFFK